METKSNAISVTRRSPGCRFRYRNPDWFDVMREIRLFLFFIVGSMLGAWSVLSYAGTYDGTVTWTISGQAYPNDPEGALTQYCTLYSKPLGTVVYATSHKISTYCGGTQYIYLNGSVSCPNGGLMSYPNGTTWPVRPTCTKLCDAGQELLPDGSCAVPCVADQVRDSSGVCQCPVGKTLDGGVCKTACPEGYHRFNPDDGRCEKDCIGNQVQDSTGVCKCNPTSNGIYSLTTAGAGSAGCDGGCVTTSFLGTVYCPKSSLALAPIGSVPAGTQCYGYGGRTGDVCQPSTPPRVDVTLAQLPPPAPVPAPVTPTPENPNPVPADPLETVDNNKDPVACGAAGGAYYTSNGQGKCGTPTDDNSMEGVKAKVKETITKNPDGSETITTEKETDTTDPKTGQTTTKKGTTTTTKDAAGNVTGTGSSETSSVKDSKEGEGGGQCAKEPDSPMCRKGVVGGVKGKFEGRGEEIEAAKAELKALFTTVSADAKSLFGDLSGGAGGLPCPPSITVLGSEFKLCAADFSNQLSIIGTAIYLVCALAAAMLIFA